MLIQELSQVQNKQQKQNMDQVTCWSGQQTGVLQMKKKKMKKKIHQETESDLTDFEGVHLLAVLL